MGEVQASDVHAYPDHLLDGGLIVAGGSDGGDDLGAPRAKPADRVDGWIFGLSGRHIELSLDNCAEMRSLSAGSDCTLLVHTPSLSLPLFKGEGTPPGDW